MQHEHCGFCGFMGLTKMPIEGMKKCSRCNWEGYPESSSMEELNKLAKGYRPGSNWAPPIKASIPEEDIEPVQKTGDPMQRNLDQRKGSFRMDDKKAFTSENKIGDRQVSEKVPKNQELINRLKAKNFKGADFL